MYVIFSTNYYNQVRERRDKAFLYRLAHLWTEKRGSRQPVTSLCPWPSLDRSLSHYQCHLLPASIALPAYSTRPAQLNWDAFFVFFPRPISRHRFLRLFELAVLILADSLLVTSNGNELATRESFTYSLGVSPSCLTTPSVGSCIRSWGQQQQYWDESFSFLTDKNQGEIRFLLGAGIDPIGVQTWIVRGCGKVCELIACIKKHLYRVSAAVEKKIG